MRNLYLTFLMCAIFALAAYADPVTVEQARQAALRHIAESSNATGGSAKAKSGSITLTLAKTAMQASPGGGETPLYYVFNRDGDSGMVIVAGDDSMRPILAYTDKGRFDEANVNPGMAWWLEAMAHATQSITEGTVNAAETRAPTTGGRSVAPLIQTQWDQGGVFQLLCPDDYVHGGKSLTGCVATAMAQIMYYHKWPVAETKDIPAYQMSNGELIAGANPVTLDWDAMQSTYTGSEAEDDPSALAVAQLMVLCGKSVKMSYSSSASGAASESVPAALKEYFDYDGAAHMVYRDEYANADWEKMIYDELAAKRPVYLSGTSISGTSVVGHAFVCDGYDGEGLFHINWGWGGMSDGFFRLTLLNPDGHGTGGNNGSGGFNMDEGAIIGIQPNQGGTSQEVAQMTLDHFAATEETVTRNSVYGSFSVPVNAACWNNTSQTLSVELGLAYYDESNEMVGEPSGLGSYSPDTGYGLSYDELSMGDGIKEGTYYVKFVHKVNGSDEWTLMKNADKHYLELQVNGTTATIVNHAPQQDFVVNDVNVQGNMSVGSQQTFTYNITNTGNTYTQKVTFFVNKEIVSQIGLNLDPGATDDYVFSWTPAREGTYEIGLATGDGTEIITSQKVTIGEAKSHELDVTFQFDDAEGSEILGYEVSGNSIKGTMSVTNKGEEDFLDNITCRLYFDGGDHKLYPASSNTIFVEVKARESVDVPFEFSDLDYSKRYMVIVNYMSAGEYAPDIRSSFITLKDNSNGIEGVEVDGEAETDQPVYNLQGVRMPDGVSLPKGIYIKGGKKIVVK